MDKTVEWREDPVKGSLYVKKYILLRAMNSDNYVIKDRAIWFPVYVAGQAVLLRMHEPYSSPLHYDHHHFLSVKKFRQDYRRVPDALLELIPPESATLG